MCNKIDVLFYFIAVRRGKGRGKGEERGKKGKRAWKKRGRGEEPLCIFK